MRENVFFLQRTKRSLPLSASLYRSLTDLPLEKDKDHIDAKARCAFNRQKAEEQPSRSIWLIQIQVDHILKKSNRASQMRKRDILHAIAATQKRWRKKTSQRSKVKQTTQRSTDDKTQQRQGWMCFSGSWAVVVVVASYPQDSLSETKTLVGHWRKIFFISRNEGKSKSWRKGCNKRGDLNTFLRLRSIVWVLQSSTTDLHGGFLQRFHSKGRLCRSEQVSWEGRGLVQFRPQTSHQEDPTFRFFLFSGVWERETVGEGMEEKKVTDRNARKKEEG